jgi:predicted O-methyltransferase YrrM
LETLPRLSPSFDVAFIDANKETYLEYYLEAKRLVRPGGVIIADNAVQDFTVARPEITNPQIEGIRRLLNHLKTDKDADGTTLTTVAAERLDGFMYIYRN